jgi:phosphoglycolate phosphatase
MKLIAFDLDNTIAKLNRPASRRTVEALLDFERKGVRIALLSGKPTSYLCGFVRQMGLAQAIISGENGVTIQYGAKFPPSQFYFTIELDEQSVDALRNFEGVLRKQFGQDVWIQPNIVNLTSFPVRIEISEVLFEFFEGYVKEHKQEFDGFMIYKHVDAIELVPLSVDKGVALKKIMKIEKLGKDQVGAVGDSESDVPMLEQVENSFGIGISPAKYKVRSIDEAIRGIKGLLKFS